MIIDLIYVKLIDEVIDVFKPVAAVAVGPSRYCILRPDGYVLSEEEWEFKPGQIVNVERRRFENGEGFLAVSSEDVSRK